MPSAKGSLSARSPRLHLFDEVNKTGASVASHVDEMQMANLKSKPSQFVKPPRVAKSPASLECRYHQTVELPAADAQADPYLMVIGEVVGVYIDDKVLKDGRYSADMVKALGRLGYFDYTVAGCSCQCSGCAESVGTIVK